MRHVYPLIILLVSLSTHAARAQGSPQFYKMTAINVPPTQGLITSCYINEENRVFLPLNGGIYIPQDSMWFIPPSSQYYFTSFAPNLIDTAFFAIANTLKNSELFYVKTSHSTPTIRYPVLTLERGIFNLIYKNKLCYVWGYSEGESKIGLLVNDQIKWLFVLTGIIIQVQVNDAGEIFFAVGESIYQLNKPWRVVTHQGKLYGFDFDKHQNLVLSCDQGVGYLDKEQTLTIVAKNMFGTVTVHDDAVFVLPARGNTMYKIDKVFSK